MSRLYVGAGAILAIAGLAALTLTYRDRARDLSADLAECRAAGETRQEIDDALFRLPDDLDAVRERLRELARPGGAGPR